MITTTKASIGAIVTPAVARQNTSLALAALASTAGCLDHYGRYALSRSVITLSRFTLTVNATVTVRASSFARPASTSGWWYE
tara:strand:- start:844 stop:1089 length:246 start_codon:yes stop_codon:yes gene_type:complete